MTRTLSVHDSWWLESTLPEKPQERAESSPPQLRRMVRSGPRLGCRGFACGRTRQVQRGQSLLETALVMPLLLLLVCGTVDMSRLFFAHLTLQHAIDEAARYAVTGQHMTDPDTAKDMTRVNSIIRKARESAMGFDISDIVVSSGGKTGDAGGPLDVVTISLTTRLKLMTPVAAQFFPGGAYQFTVSTAFRNEPFSPDAK